MGSFQPSQDSAKRGGKPGKILAPLDLHLRDVKWGQYRIGDFFSSSNGDFDIQKSHINDKGEWVITAGLTNNGILGRTDVKAKVFEANTITIDMFGAAFYRQFQYKLVTHARVFSLKPNFEMTKQQGLFFANAMTYFKSQFGYSNMCSWEKIRSKHISLPQTSAGEIDFEFIDKFVRELERARLRELEAYLVATGLNNYELTVSDKAALIVFLPFNGSLSL